MKQHEQVIEFMRRKNGLATLGELYELYDEYVEASGAKWGTKTPYASIRRIVQKRREFFNIKPGLWALKEFREQVLEELGQGTSSSKDESRGHYFYQGKLVEIGNARLYDTFVPRQDKNRLFRGRTLGDMASLQAMPEFGYEYLIERADKIDVLWFNRRRMPQFVFEVEHTTDMRNSLSKFLDLQDFHIRFFIVASPARESLFHKRIHSPQFTDIRSRVDFISYEKLANWPKDSLKFEVTTNG